MSSIFFGFTPAPKVSTNPFFGAAPLGPSAPFFGPAPLQPSTNPFWHTQQQIHGYDPSGSLPSDGPGNDLVVVGQTRAGQYSADELTRPLNLDVDLSSVVSLDAINNRQAEGLQLDTRFEGGVNRLFVYGDADFTNAELKFIDWIIPVKAQVTFTAQQL